MRLYTHIRASLCHNVISFFTFYNRTRHTPDGARERDYSRLRESQRAADIIDDYRVLSFPFLSFLFFNRQEKKNNPIESTYVRFAKHLAKL